MTAVELVCPVCHGGLASGETDVECARCGRTYPLREGVVDATPVPPPDEAVLQRWHVWEQLQRNGAAAYDRDPSSNLSVGGRADAAAFAAYYGDGGTVLDVGCGPQPEPSYRHSKGVFVGIDPLRGATERRFQFVQGIGEYLPFAAGMFDKVLFATSLDHSLVPERVLAEARRVLKPEGRVFVWFGNPQQETAALARARRALSLARAGHFRSIGRRLFAILRGWRTARASARRTPAGAVDEFHLHGLDEPSLRRWLDAAGLAVEDASAHGTGGRFVRAAPVDAVGG